MLAVFWFILVLSFIMMYVLSDGYDLGVGILTLFERDKERKQAMIELVANVWDANETWIVMTGVALWGGFPMIYGSVLQFLYPVLFTMLFGLILRGFSNEMISSQGINVHHRWHLAFGFGSLIAALAQGVALGSLTSKILIENFTNMSKPGSFFSWYSVLFMCLVVAAYVTLGLAYLKFHRINLIKTGQRGIIMTLVTLALLVVALVTINYTAAPLNFNDPWRVTAFISFMVLAVIGVTIALLNFSNQKETFGAQAYPMGGLILATVATVLAFTVTHFPIIVPGVASPSAGVVINAASSNVSTYRFLLVGVGMWIPLMWYFAFFVHHSLIKRGKNGIWSLIGVK
ncbi:MAG: cytochrome d ubiquinol oxidase subunit II [Lactobacillaceae bacterium]|jgi:cytochrome d ubiquinol oxidase subunit II|nr:cytochrome d ubiquinol oxidase subunit II [Lactobacillaceae bacterium]